MSRETTYVRETVNSPTTILTCDCCGKIEELKGYENDSGEIAAIAATYLISEAEGADVYSRYEFHCCESTLLPLLNSKLKNPVYDYGLQNN